VKPVLSLLENPSERAFITYRSRTETQKSFVAYVDHLYGQVKNTPELQTDEFTLIETEDPIEFYALLFALWRNNNKALFPTRDYLTFKSGIDFHQNEISSIDGKIHVTVNTDHRRIHIPQTGDTILFSSGSTGVPKGILHHRDHFLANALAVGKGIRHKHVTNITCLKPYLVSAISHILVHYWTASHIVFVDFSQVHTIETWYHRDRRIGIVGSPMHLIAALQYIPSTAEPSMFFSSGDAISAATIANIFTRFPLTTFYHVYGLAELAGRFFVNSLDSSTPKSQYESIGENIDGTTYELRKEQIYVDADYLFLGYIRDDAFEPSQVPHPTGDLARPSPEGLFLRGRTDDEIKVLGNKISLKHIERKIKNALNEDTAVVLATSHPQFGNILSLVLPREIGIKRTDLIRRIRSTLNSHEVPHKFYVVDEFPFTQSMKIDRNKLLRELDSLEAIHD
jgi:acyl-CoA synthetase (AMP-forming)/AMP-acid ligase II